MRSLRWLAMLATMSCPTGCGLILGLDEFVDQPKASAAGDPMK